MIIAHRQARHRNRTAAGKMGFAGHGLPAAGFHGTGGATRNYVMGLRCSVGAVLGLMFQSYYSISKANLEGAMTLAKR